MLFASLRYLTLVRKLQTVYRMEPAGSQGVWALDDYQVILKNISTSFNLKLSFFVRTKNKISKLTLQFVPFIWGSAQLIGDPRIEPRWIPDQEKAEALSKDYILFG